MFRIRALVPTRHALLHVVIALLAVTMLSACSSSTDNDECNPEIESCE